MYKLSLVMAAAAALAFASGAFADEHAQNNTCRDANGRPVPCVTPQSPPMCAEGKHCPNSCAPGDKTCHAPEVSSYQSGGHGH